MLILTNEEIEFCGTETLAGQEQGFKVKRWTGPLLPLRGIPVTGSDTSKEFHDMKHVFISWYFQQYYNENRIVKVFKTPLIILKT